MSQQCYCEKYTVIAKDIVLKSFYPISFAMSSKDPLNLIDLPNELLETVMVYLSIEDLFSLAVVGNKRLRNCAYALLSGKNFGRHFFRPCDI